MDHSEVALVSLITGIGVALVCVVFLTLGDLVASLLRWVRLRGRPPCTVCGERTQPDDPEFCENHIHLRVLRRRARSLT